MGELQIAPFQFTFNGFLKVAFQGSRITSDAGLILVRELDERLGLARLIAAHLRDLGLIRFGGHLPRGEYDVDHDGHAGQADAAELHG